MSDLFSSSPPADVHDRALIEAYARVGRTLDDLPYTPEFDAILAQFRRVQPDATPREVLQRLQNIRKAGRLPRLGRAWSPPPLLSTVEELAILNELVVESIGSLGQRDQLPYTPTFDRLVERFNARTGRALTPHDVWRLVASLAK